MRDWVLDNPLTVALGAGVCVFALAVFLLLTLNGGVSYSTLVLLTVAFFVGAALLSIALATSLIPALDPIARWQSQVSRLGESTP